MFKNFREADMLKVRKDHTQGIEQLLSNTTWMLLNIASTWQSWLQGMHMLFLAPTVPSKIISPTQVQKYTATNRVWLILSVQSPVPPIGLPSPIQFTNFLPPNTPQVPFPAYLHPLCAKTFLKQLAPPSQTKPGTLHNIARSSLSYTHYLFLWM